MGTNDEPVLVMSASGRQTAKASEWTENFLRRCRVALCDAHARLTAEHKAAAAAPKDDAEAQKALAYFAGKDITTLAILAARSEMRAERDPVTADLLDEHFAVIFEGIAARAKTGSAASDNAATVGLLSSVLARRAVEFLSGDRRSDVR